MYKQTNTKDIRLFLDIAGIEEVKDMDEILTKCADSRIYNQ